MRRTAPTLLLHELAFGERPLRRLSLRNKTAPYEGERLGTGGPSSGAAPALAFSAQEDAFTDVAKHRGSSVTHKCCKGERSIFINASRAQDGSDACVPTSSPSEGAPTTTLKFGGQDGALRRRAARDRWPELGRGCHEEDGRLRRNTPAAARAAVNTSFTVPSQGGK